MPNEQDQVERPVQRAGPPVIILIEPQMGENIGAAARAMRNFRLSELRIVRPRDGWPNEKAIANSSGAGQILEDAKLFISTADAVADLHRVYAATARQRDMVKAVVTPRQAAVEMRAARSNFEKCGIMFGGERAGLNNDDLVLADTVLTTPSNPEFSSLNLAQCVLLVAYEWHLNADDTPPRIVTDDDTRPANKKELVALFEHLEAELIASGFLWPAEKRPAMVRSIRNMIQRANFTEQDVRTLRGAIASLARNS
jgi:tRNA/rRNA methyltransferase